MTTIRALSSRAVAGVFLLLASTPASRAFAKSEEPRPVRVSVSDVEASNKKIGMAYGALMQWWTSQFDRIGETFEAPRIVRYNEGGYTACGPIGPSNAIYCPVNNTIYYDQVFVAGMQKIAGRAVGTDGDMAAVGIIAHEVGHAVAMQLGYHSRSSYENESTADCLAGAFANQAQHDGSLEKGDVEEAVFGMSMAGDPTPQSTGNRRRDALIQARLAHSAHGTKEQRMENFREGLAGGAGVCLQDFQ
ncbi:MAG TPA: neutral zinc metallopeptidase [Gemmatimonadaceae bacterium]